MVIPLLGRQMSAAKNIRHLYHCKASLTDCFQSVYVRPASGDWLPLNLQFVIVADYPLKVGKEWITVAVSAPQKRKVSELPARR
jgi:hypothetical protein